ncbi:MAG: cytochrome c family protein [Planctomycetes bacterium]|nr:cytochrome c family protein [Planctomycetota bacterium]MCC7397436.1 cytochrome c3 family protein [Planctomycetota bacterium]
MTVLFPKWTNKIPAMLALGAAATGLCVVFVVSYWFSPKNTDVGYQPFQPIEYSHELHVGLLGMDCRYCHRLVEEGPHATVPDTATCMGCHKEVKKDSVLSEPLRTAFGDGITTDTPIEWVKVHLLPEFSYFNHAVHVRSGVGCASCHGRVDQMAIVTQDQPLSMGWCLECHRDPTPHLRPSGVSPTKMDWVADEASIAAARQRLEWRDQTPPELNPPTHCSACHR